jgi:hypothetical protein
VHGAPSFVLRALAGILLIAFNWRAACWAERVARRKGIYHPQYFVLGPIGLLMALATRPNKPGRPAGAPPTQQQPNNK